MIARPLALGLALVALLVFAVPANAVLSGKNGRIAFTSGRAAGDATAQIYTINPINLGPVEGPFSIPLVQNRHASWSPDRTKLVFAAGTPGSLATEEYDLFVKDMPSGSVTALDQSEIGDGLSSDHPAWSPDGTRIAYEHQPTDNSTDRNIMVKTGLGSADGVPLANSADFELKAAWSPDSQEIYYAKSPTAPPTTQFDIVKKAANASSATAPTNVANSNTIDEYQPSISPDGSKICFTRQSTLSNTATADVYVADLPGLGNQRDISDNTSIGDINCTWSPDGSKIAFSNGTFSQARLMVENANDADDAAAANELTNDPGGNDFDGNADWAPDGTPLCPDITATTTPNTPVTINLECTDTGPAYERTDPNGFVTTPPKNGTTSDDSVITNPSTTKYTPKAGFTGTDTFEYGSFDDFGFGTDTGKVTVSVKAPGGGGGGGGGGGAGGAKPKCGGKTATIIGTAGNDVLVGTNGNDVIVGLGGNDRIRGGRGRDIICGGSGRDRLSGGRSGDRIGGGRGNDRVGGGSGNDRLSGNSGKDRISGDSGRDSLRGGSGADKLRGGAGRDRLNGNSGRDRLNGGSGRDRCKGGSGRDRASRCERTSGIP